MVGHAKTNAASEFTWWRIVGPSLLFSGAARPSDKSSQYSGYSDDTLSIAFFTTLIKVNVYVYICEICIKTP